MINQNKCTKSIKDIKVLYVEDDKNIADELMEMLKIHIDKIYYASNGQDGLEIFKKYGIDLIISDIKMPKMDGIQMAKEIRKIDSTVQIIITSAFSEVKYFQEAIEIGVDNYLLKPINIEKLLNVIHKSASNFLQKKQLNDYMIFSEMVMNSTSNFIVLATNGEIEFKNKSLLNKLNIDDMSFKSFCISDYILDKDGNKKFKDKEDMLSYLRKHTTKQIIFYMKKERADLNEPLCAYLVSDSYFESTDKHLIVFTDVTKLNEEKEQYEIESITDGLTKLKNKFYFSKVLSKMVYEAKADYRYKLSLIILDIDFFKNINDTYGHQVGDKVLEELAFLIQRTVRTDDIVARWGGEEFVVLGNFDKYGAVLLAQKLRKQIESYKFQIVENLTCSFGVTQYSKNNNDDEKSLLARADDALYKAKKNGRNCVELKEI